MPSTQGEGPVAAAGVLLELIELGQRIERREQRAEGQQHEPARRIERQPGAAQPASGVRVPNPNMLMIQSAPATALSRSGGTEYSDRHDEAAA